MKNWSVVMSEGGVNGWMTEGEWVMTAPTGFLKIAKVTGATPLQAEANREAVRNLPRMVELLTIIADTEPAELSLRDIQAKAMTILNREIDDRDFGWVGRERWDKEGGRMIVVVSSEGGDGYLIRDPKEGHVPANRAWLAEETEQMVWRGRPRVLRKNGTRIRVIDDVVDRLNPMRSIHTIINLDNPSDGLATMTHAELLAETEEPK